MNTTPSHAYSALCGCNDCEIEGHAQDNIRDSMLADEWDSVIAEREIAHVRQLEAEENERTEREDSYDVSF